MHTSGRGGGTRHGHLMHGEECRRLGAEGARTLGREGGARGEEESGRGAHVGEGRGHAWGATRGGEELGRGQGRCAVAEWSEERRLVGL